MRGLTLAAAAGGLLAVLAAAWLLALLGPLDLVIGV